MGSEPDDDLEARVERLEEQVSKQMPSRRQLLAGAGTLGVGALLGGGAGSAAAADGTQDTSDGTVRGNGGGVDIRLDELRDPGGDEVFDIDDTGAINAAVSGREFRFDSINTPEAAIGKSPPKPVISNNTQTLFVDPNNGDDSNTGTESDPLRTIQEAVNRVPLIMRYKWKVDLNNAPSTPVNYNEDVELPAFITSGSLDTTGGSQALRIVGDPNDNTAVTVNSIYSGGVFGSAAVSLENLTFNQNTSLDDESAAVSFENVREGKLFNCRTTTGPANFISLKNADVKVSECDFSNVSNNAVTAKRHSGTDINNCTGTPGSSLIFARENSYATIRQNLPGGSIDTDGGLVRDSVNGKWFGLDEVKGKTSFRDRIALVRGGTTAGSVEATMLINGAGDLEISIRDDGNEVIRMNFDPDLQKIRWFDESDNQTADLDTVTGDMRLAGSLTENFTF